MKDSSKIKAIVVVLVSCLFLSGCFGSFGATRLLYNWNSSIGDKGTGGRILRTLIMYCLMVTGYPLFFLGDFFILNLIEFFTGERVVDAKVERLENGDIWVYSEDGRTYNLKSVSADSFVVEHNGYVIGKGEVDESGQFDLIRMKTDAETGRYVEAF